MQNWQELHFGPKIDPHGISFMLFAKGAKECELITSQGQLFPMKSQEGDLFSLFLPDIDDLSYRFKIDGTEVIDPWAAEIDSSHTWGDPFIPWSRIRKRPFDWGGGQKPNIPKNRLRIYELHVRAFTQKADVRHPGTFLGLIEKLPYLASLGFNALELMPVQEFHEGEVQLKNPYTEKRLWNFWGYSPVSFFALMNRYGVKETLAEFKELVKAAHLLGLEILLDLVFNHTAEGNEFGPTYHFKKMGDDLFYRKHQGHYINVSGCGNSCQCENFHLQEMILQALRFFALECQVDGFRFDLATILAYPTGSLIRRITEDPFIHGVKLIAEPWDIAHFSLGSFYPESPRWGEWNSYYRDTARAFMRGDSWKKGDLATRLSGSQDLFGDKEPSCSINFITCHDGFTLHDLVSYDHKHNLSNGENGRDGTNNNISSNCGKEGETKDPEILEIRKRKIGTFLALLFLSKGTPLFSMGDEIGHTKKGNNNSWSHDDELNYFDWSQVEGSELIPYIQKLMEIRSAIPEIEEDRFLEAQDIYWFSEWEADDKILSYLLAETLFVAINGNHAEVTISLPPGRFINPFGGGNNEVTKEATCAPFATLILIREV